MCDSALFFFFLRHNLQEKANYCPIFFDISQNGKSGSSTRRQSLIIDARFFVVSLNLKKNKNKTKMETHTGGVDFSTKINPRM